MSSIIGAVGTTVDLQAGPAAPAGIIGLLHVDVMAAPPAPIALPAVPTTVEPPVPGAPPVPATSPPVPVAGAACSGRAAASAGGGVSHSVSTRADHCLGACATRDVVRAARLLVRRRASGHTEHRQERPESKLASHHVRFPSRSSSVRHVRTAVTRCAVLNVTLRAGSSNENLRKFPLRFAGILDVAPQRRIPPVEMDTASDVPGSVVRQSW